MGISNQLSWPNSDEDFEVMCHVLYGMVYKSGAFSRVGGHGQKQFGVDILGYDGLKPIGIQCKRYTKKVFDLSTIKADIKKVEESDLKIDCLLFATTASSRSDIVKAIFELSNERQKQGKFSISVNFWEDISGYVRLYPEVGRTFIPGFPGSTTLDIKDAVGAHLDLYLIDRDRNTQVQSDILANTEKILNQLGTYQQDSMPPARGDEADPRVVASLNLIRDKLREGNCREALDQLNALGDPEEFKDQFSRFRWYTNFAFVDLLEGRYEAAASGFLAAYQLAPEDEKANANRTHAFILNQDYESALSACEAGLKKYPMSNLLWSLKLNILQSLGDPEPDRNLPKDLRNNSDVLFALAHLTRMKGEYPAALEQLRQCIDKDGGSFNAKRTYLADALSWCSLDIVLAHHGQLSCQQRSALSDALSRLEPLEQTIPAIQSDHTSEELANNVTLALVLLGLNDRAYSLASHLLARHPLLEGLLRIRLLELDERKDLTAIHKLTDKQIENLPPAILGILAEIAANQGDKAWYAEVMKLAEVSKLDPIRLEELRILSIHLTWVDGSKTDAIQAAQDYLVTHPEHVLARVILAKMLLQSERFSEATIEASTCIGYLPNECSSLDVLNVAELLYSLQEFSKASSIYSRLVRVPGDDEFTHRLLACLIESDQRHKAQDILNQLTPEVRELSAFRRIEANLARRMGDWARMRDLLAIELNAHPESIGVALGYVGALYRLNDEATLKGYLGSNPIFKNSSAENEFEFSKYEANSGFSSQALNRLYRLYRNNSNSTQVGSFFLVQILIGQDIPEMKPPLVAGSGCAIYLKNAAETRCIAIDTEPSNNLVSWPELISPDSNISKLLMGSKISDHITLEQNLGNSKFEVTCIESIYSFAARKAQEIIALAAEPAGPLWSVRLINEDGTLDISTLLQSAKRRKEHVQRIFDTYKQHRIPIAMLAKALGSDPVTLLLEWPFREAPLFVGFGSHQERENSVKILQQQDQRYVLDLLSITELMQRKCFDQVIKLIGRPLIPQTLKEHLMVILQQAETHYPSSSLGVNNDQLVMAETPVQYYDNRLLFLKEMLRCINEYCDVVPTVGPHEITDMHRLLAEVLDHDSLDAVYLSIERDAILISDDGALRLIAAEAGVSKSIGIQPILMEACDRRIITKDVYADAVFGKLAAGHDFVSIRADDMFTIAKRTPFRVSDVIRKGLETFHKPTLDIESGIRVSCEFLIRIIMTAQPKVAVAYVESILEALQYERPQIAHTIHSVVAHAVNEALKNSSCKMKIKDRKLFNGLLNFPSENKVVTRRRLIPLAIQGLFRPEY